MRHNSSAPASKKTAVSQIGGNQNPNWVVCVIYVFVVAFVFVSCVMLAVAAIRYMEDTPPQPLPKLSVSNFSATFVNATSTFQFALNFTVTKPESDLTKTMVYDNIVASLYYDNNLIGTTTLFPFQQKGEKNGVAAIKARFMVDQKAYIGVVGAFCVRLSANTVLIDEPGHWVMRRKLDVFCEDIQVESRSMVGTVRDCRVEPSYI